MKNSLSLGVMLNMSSNGVMSVDALKRYLPLLKKFGYNTVLLYIEDTYEVDGEPYFGYMRGRYTKREMKELDAFAVELGIEIIPCMQTLAHLISLKKFKQYPFDYDDILLVDNDRTYTLIEHMFATLSECFSTRRIHIGMDEAHMLGLGKHLDQFGYEKNSSIMKRHLKKVCELAQKHGYTEQLLWSDMLFRGWNNNAYHPLPYQTVPKEYKDILPASATPVYWDYYQQTEKEYADMLDMHLDISDKSWFAGGVWNWFGFCPGNEFTLKTMKPALDACGKRKISNIFMTMWGHGETSRYSVLPSLLYVAEYAKGNTDEEKIKAKFKRIVGIDYDDYIKLDLPNLVTQEERTGTHPQNPASYMLFSDCLYGFFDPTVKPGGSKHFATVGAELRQIAKKSRTYGYVFDQLAKLCEALEVKYELGVKTRRAYESGDKEALRRLADDDYARLPRLIDAFAKATCKVWTLENKPAGIEQWDIRFGGVIRRVESVRKKLLAYCNGQIDRIEELEEKLLPYTGSIMPNHPYEWTTVNKIIF